MNENPIVLIVDNSAEVRGTMRELLVDQNLEIYEAADGKGALVKIEKINPDLVCLDAELPTLDGEAALRKIREKYDPAELPVIMIAGDKGEITLKKFSILGCQGYIVKPFDAQKVILEINTILNRPLPSGRSRVHPESLRLANDLLGRLGNVFRDRFLAIVANLLTIRYAALDTAITPTEAAISEEVVRKLEHYIRVQDCREYLIHKISRIPDADHQTFLDEYYKLACDVASRIYNDKDAFKEFIEAYILKK